VAGVVQGRLEVNTTWLSWPDWQVEISPGPATPGMTMPSLYKVMIHNLRSDFIHTRNEQFVHNNKFIRHNSFHQVNPELTGNGSTPFNA